MPLLDRPSKSEADAVKKLVKQINGIDDDQNKVGRYVLGMFLAVFALAGTLLAVILLNP